MQVDVERGEAIENRFYRLAFDRKSGIMTSLFDKELGHELIDGDAPHPFGRLIVRVSETAEEELLQVTRTSVVESGPVSTTIRFEGNASCCPRVTIEVTLYHTLKRVDLCARILRDSTPMRELYLAFPFRVESPRFHFEGTGSVIEPIRLTGTASGWVWMSLSA